MAAAQLDSAQLASHCSLPQQSIDTLLDTPTADLVRTLLENVSAKAREYSEITSEKFRLEVELENAVRGGESKNRVLKGTVDKSLKEAADLRQKLQAEETARQSLENELQDLKDSTSTSTSEISTLKARIESLESSNRDALSLLESKSTAYDKLGEELNTQHQKTIELRQQVSTLEQSVQSANASSTSAKFHEQGLQQEIESLKRNNDWLDKELKTKSAEYTKYRKEKSLRIAELQRQYDEAQSIIDSSNRTETTLRRRLEELNQKADDSFSRIQQMQEEAARKDQDFRQELDSASRLTELTQNSLNTERQRQQDLFIQLETAKEDASEQLGQLSAELETEHAEREAAEAKIAELDLHVERLQADLAALRNQPSTSGSSHHGINGFAPGSPARGTSTPQGTPGTPRPKGGLSVTQMYSNLNDARNELAYEKGRNQQLATTLDELVQELSTRQPEVEELQADHGRLESEVAELSSLVEIVGKERDQALKETKKWQGQIQAKAKEGDVLRQQLRDLSSQIKVFLMEVHLRDQGHVELGTEARAQLERLAQGQRDGEASEGVTATDRLISEQLVTFRNIAELQDQNTNLLKITRQLGERMEHEEAVRIQTENARNWDELQQKYERCKDEIKSLVTQSQSYIRERDMFRRMLSNRGQLPAGSDMNSMFGESMNGDAPTTPRPNNVMDSIENSPSAKDLADYAKLYKDMQQHFDDYRNETATDRSTLKEQIDGLSRQNGELRSEVVRSSSQVTLAHERYEMLQTNYGMLKNENLELQKRSQNLSDGAIKQELRVQQVAEELVEAKGLIDSMRNENANLKAEKDFWKTIEKRITEDSENLLNERGRLNALNVNLQNLLNEREHSDTEARRRLQSHADSLEKDLQSTKAKLSEEIEENKRNAQRREYDHEQSQKRIDDLVSSLGSIREQLVAANTAKDHLSSRVDELTIQLRSAEERVNVLQPTPKSRPQIASGDNEEHQAPSESADSGLSREQELAVQVSELKRDLDLKEADLENLKAQVEQYKEISQVSEEELQSLNETQDLYKQEMDKLIEEKDAKIKDLEQRVEGTTAELASSNTELADLRNEQAEHDRRLDEQRKAFELELSQIKDQDERHATECKFLQEDLKAQAEIAQQSQQNYESELIKHGDAAKALQKVRSDYNELKLEVVEVKMAAESARTSLSQSEESWVESRNRYEGELAELKTGREHLTAQNNRLHQQLESVTSQISTLKKRASGGDEGPGEDVSGSSLDNLQEVIKYLRREKEIVDVQLELSSQEGKRLKQQLDYTQSQLDDTRLRLDQQRRLEADSERSNLDHNRLMETINELNTFRESSVTLRAESRQAQASLATRIKEVEELTARIEPLKAEIVELKNERETQEGEMKLLKENSDRWQQRAQNILQKYDRVDPAELEALKEQVKALEAERDALLASKESLQEKADSASHQMAQVQDQSNEKFETMKARLTDQFKSRSKALSDRIREKDTALQAAASEKHDLEQRIAGLSDLQSQLDMAKSERDAAIEKASSQTGAVDSEMQDGSEEGQVEEGGQSKSLQDDSRIMQDKLAAAEARADQEASESANLRAQLETYESRMAELEKQIIELQESIDASRVEVDQLRNAQQEQQPHISNNGEAEQQIQQLREGLALAQKETEDLRTNASVNVSLANAPTEDGSKSVADQVAEHVEAVRVELEARHNERMKIADETLANRTNQMKANLSKKLTEGKTQIRQTLTAEHEQAIQALKVEHEKELESLRNRHKDELDEVRKLVEGSNKLPADVRNADGPSDVKIEDQTSRAPYQPTEAEAKVLVQSNEILRSILRQNVVKQVAKAKDEVSTQLKEEHEKVLAEIQTKSESAKAHAVLMEGKKNALQINMASNKFKNAQFKVDLVQKSAQETPQKPVAEVWISVKDARPPPAPAGPSQTQQGAPQRPKTPVANPFGQPTSTPQFVAQQKPPQGNAQVPPLGISTFGRPTPTAPAPRVSSPTTQQSPQQKPGQFNAQSQAPSGISTFGRPTPAAAGGLSQPPTRQSPQQKPLQAQPAESAPNGNQPSIQQATPPPQSAQQKPVPGPPSVGNAGSGQSASRGLQQSGLPMPRGGSIRGTSNPRGRGSGIGRGGPPINTNQIQGQQGRGSPVGGALNAGAKQFVPGNKRPRDESQEGQPGDGKRIRGGGAGS
ncbi:nucleoprotein TPR, partial [Lecanoromycetidae sp. Uapishka_2]